MQIFNIGVYTMISGVGNISGIAHANYGVGSAQSMSFSSGGKLYVPVSPAMVGYTQFEHVRGVASDSPSGGVNISKIKILNTLIDRLIDMKQTPTVTKNNTEISDAQVDALIKDYQNQIKNTVNIAQSNPYALSGATASGAGALFSIAA